MELFTDFRKQQLKYRHLNYLWNYGHDDKLVQLMLATPISTGYHLPEGCMHITQRNICILLHKLGLRL